MFNWWLQLQLKAHRFHGRQEQTSHDGENEALGWVSRFKVQIHTHPSSSLAVPPPPALMSLTPQLKLSNSSEGSCVHPPRMIIFFLTVVWVVHLLGQLSTDRLLWPTIYYMWNRCCSWDWQWNQRSSFSEPGRLEGEEHGHRQDLAGLIQPPDATMRRC